MSKEPKHELVPVDELFPVFKQDVESLAELIEENLGGQMLSRFELERLKVNAAGAPGFVVQRGDEQVDLLKELEVIVVHSHQGRVYHINEMGEGDPVPDCSSEDGKHGSGNNGTGVSGSHLCEGCPQNQWGTERKGGRGKACHEQRILYLYRSGAASVFPSMLILPTTSLRGWRNYTVDLTQSGQRLATGMHRLTTVADKNADGKPFSRVVPRFVRQLSSDEVAQVLAFGDAIKSTIATPRQEKHEPVGDDDGLPF